MTTNPAGETARPTEDNLPRVGQAFSLPVHDSATRYCFKLAPSAPPSFRISATVLSCGTPLMTEVLGARGQR